MVSLFPFGAFRTVTFTNLMELRCKVVGEEGEEAVKIQSGLLSVGSENEGEEVGLCGGVTCSEGYGRDEKGGKT